MSHRIHPSSSLPLSLTLYLPSPFLPYLTSFSFRFYLSFLSYLPFLFSLSLLFPLLYLPEFELCGVSDSAELSLIGESSARTLWRPEVRTDGKGGKREKRKRKLIIDVLYFQIVEINSRILTWPPPPPDPWTLTPHPKSHKLKIYYTFIVLWKEKEEYETPLQIYPLLFLTNLLPYYNL